MSGGACEKCGMAINVDQCPVCGQHRPCCGHVGEQCIIAPRVQVGWDTRIWHWVQVREDAQIGTRCVIGSRVEIGPGVVIGGGTHVGAGSQLHHPARVGRGVFLGPNVFLGNDKYPGLEGAFSPQGVAVGDYAIIGAGAQIVGGVSIGEGAFVAMGALVTRDVGEGEMVKGSPARPYARRVMHYHGTAVQHWGPLCDEQECLRCTSMGVEQYVKQMRQRQEEQEGA